MTFFIFECRQRKLVFVAQFSQELVLCFLYFECVLLLLRLPCCHPKIANSVSRLQARGIEAGNHE